MEEMIMHNFSKEEEQFFLSWINRTDEPDEIVPVYIPPISCMLVARAIIQDVSLFLQEDISSPDKVCEFGNRFAQMDGLLFKKPNDLASFHGEEQLMMGRPMYTIPLTTAWIANYTQPISYQQTRNNNLKKNQRVFQIILLMYYFGMWVGNPPRRIEKWFHTASIGRYGEHAWFFDESRQMQREKMKLMFDLMHKCNLRYVGKASEDGGGDVS